MTTATDVRPLFGRHGHVNRRVDGMVNRCGGPAICSACARETCDRCGLMGTAAVVRHQAGGD